MPTHTFRRLPWLLLVVTACNQAAAGPSAARGERPPPPVYVAPVETRIVVDRIRTVGQLEPDEAVTLRSEVKGRITAVHVDDGDTVESNQILFRLNDAQAQATLAEAEARVREIGAAVRQAQDDLERERSLQAQGVIEAQQVRARQSAYDAQVASLAAAEARVQVLRVRLDDTVIRAPLAGVVGERLVYTGDYVEEGDALVEILRIDPLELRFAVSESQLAGVRKGARVDFLVPGFGDEVFHGEVYYIAPEAEITSRNVAVKAHVPNADTRLRPGFFVKLQVISAERPNTVVAPEAAVVLEGGDAWAYVLNGDTAEQRPLELGPRTEEGDYEVLGGLTAGEMLIVRGQYGLPDGARVRVIDRAADDAD